MANKGPKGKKGRPKKPTKLKVIEGGRGNRPVNKKEPKPKVKVGLLKPPVWLSKAAKAEWNRMAPALYKLGLLTEIDGSMFEAYCNAYALWRRYTAKAAKAGGDSGIISKSGIINKPSYENMAQKYLKEFTTLAGRFGLSPADRANIIAEPPPGEEDKMEALLDR